MLAFLNTLFGRAATSRLDHVHPLSWWSGMQTPTLQVMLHGQAIGDCDVTLADATNVSLVRVERVSNPNYLFVYLDVRYASPQTFGIQLTKPGQRRPLLTQPYELQQRTGEMPDAFGPQDVLYLLMPDRFVRGNAPAAPKGSLAGLTEPAIDLNDPDDMGRHGGNLAGIRQSLDYLQDLGITALWPTPVQENNGPGSYHGYAITDYYRIDPRMGTNEEFRQLVADCHAHGIKVVMDLVFNHCGANNFLFTDLPQQDWFNNDSKFIQSTYRTGSVGDPHASQYDRSRTTDGWFVRNMPDLNQRNPLVRDYLIQTAVWWTEYAHLDGIRQDTYPYADREMMAEWCLTMEREYPGYNIVGETWINNAAGVAYWQKDSKLSPVNSQLRTVMDFPLMALLNRVVDEESDDWDNGLARIYEYLTGDVVYANPDYLLTFLDNHDTNRFQATAEQAANRTRYEQALLLLLTLRGIPQLYYGDEIGMWANKSKGDGVLRQDFPVAALTAEGRDAEQAAYHDYARRLLRWRRNCPAVQTGHLTHFAVTQGCYVYSRELDGHRVTILINGTSKPVELDLERYAEVLPRTEGHDVLTDRQVKLGKTLGFEARQAYVIEF